MSACTPAEILDLFTQADAEEGRARRDAALDAHEDAHFDRLDLAREFAERVVRERGQVTADDVRAWVDREGIERGPWLGSVFRGKRWRSIGWTTSRDPTQNATGLRVWTLREVAS